VPVAWLPGFVLYASCGPRGTEYARQQKLKLVAQFDPADFHHAVHHVWGAKLLRHAIFQISNSNPAHSAKRRVSTGQILAFIGFLFCMAASFARLPLTEAWAVAETIFGLFFLAVVALRLFCILPRSYRSQGIIRKLVDAELPAYSVLVPVFREVAVLDQLLSALTQLNYPAGKLDIKIIAEESDTSMRRALERYQFPDHIEVIVVPRGRPQTKPRALNYALQFARGELLTIFDAEDIPEPNQLRHAAERFHGAGENLACLQAQLVFFNSRENWLTRQFTAEYATLFGLVLPALADQGLPLPLGGTSNHFRTDILRKIGAWDPYNVTEDADLGLRLARLGYTTDVIASFTKEEANTQLANWTRQRARWLKGFLQTWLVHMRNPIKVVQEIGLSGFWVLQSCTIGIFVSALLHPFMLAATIYFFMTNQPPKSEAALSSTLLGGMGLAVFALGYGVTMIAAHRALRLRGFRNWWLTIATMPLYWLLQSIAAWLALWQFIVAPFEWNKTEHGLSKLQKH
jgi:glycosyltransferase XagB